MPIFRYICSNCNTDFEVLLPRANSSTTCPKCGSKELSKQLNRVGMINHAAPTSCLKRNECPSAGMSSCGCGCGCNGHHRH